MADDQSEVTVWQLVTEAELDSALRESEIALTCQNAELVYTAALNPFVAQPPGTTVVGENDEALFNGVGAPLAATKRRVADSGEGESIDFSYSACVHERWYRIRLEPVTLPDGTGRGVLAASVDITRQKTAEEHLRLALLELAHRSKNLLAVVLSLARQSADDSRNLDDFRGRFLGRIRSLALAHDILTEEAWRGGTVFSLVRGQLAAFGEEAGDRFRMGGHNAFLKPNAVQYVGLAIHELIAHSVASGGLSNSTGKVEIMTAVETNGEGEQTLCLSWNETQGDADGGEAPSEFGEVLLRTIVPVALGGTAALNERDDGLSYVLRIPAAQFF